jgi:hypothetical protein
VQEYLRGCFSKWGLPKSIRVDNGKPLGDPQRKRIPELALWLIGLDIQVIFNRPRRPTDNAKVERMQQTTKNWADIKNCFDSIELQKQLDNAIVNQRTYFKVRRLGRKTRLEVFPQIISNPRIFFNNTKYEKHIFDIQKVYQALAKWQFIRLINKTGQFSLYRQVYYLDYKLAKSYIIIRLNLEKLKWDITDTNGKRLKSIKLKNFELDNILNLRICQRT